MRFRFAFVTGALAAAVLMLGLRPAASMPRLMDLYNEHPRALPQYKDKCVLNIAIDRTPERSYTFENPMSLAEAFMFMAGEIRLEGNKWGPDGSDQPDNAAN